MEPSRTNQHVVNGSEELGDVKTNPGGRHPLPAGEIEAIESPCARVGGRKGQPQSSQRAQSFLGLNSDPNSPRNSASSAFKPIPAFMRLPRASLAKFTNGRRSSPTSVPARVLV